MRFSRVRARVASTFAALGTICLTVSSVQAAGEPPSETSPEIQAKPVELALELGGMPAPPEANSSKVLLPSDPTRRVLGGAPANDACSEFVDIFDGVTDYDTTGATTDGPTHAECDASGDGGVTVNDIWYRYVATFSGPLTLSTCNEDGGDTSYDSDLVIYDGTACADLNMLGCNDDAAGACTASGTSYASRLIADVVEGNEYLIRVGGWVNSGDSGPGTLSIFGAPCGDGVCDGDENCGNCAADCGECACANVFPGDCDDANIGILGDFIQECGDGGWISLAFPIETGGGMIDTVAFHLATNRAGGDVYIMGDAGCRPDTGNILVSLCCALSGLTPNAGHELHFDAVMTSADEPTWVVLVERTGLARINNLGFFNGEAFKAFGLSRSNLESSLPNRAFANLEGTGNPGDWTDLHFLGAGLGTSYCVGLSATGQDPGGPYDCVANSDPTGGCCNVDGDECQMMRGFECGIAGGIYIGDGTTCADCFAACNSEAGECCSANGTAGCNDPMCCHYVCLQDPFCCGDEPPFWDAACRDLAIDPEIGCGQTDQACEPGGCVDETANSAPECVRTGSDLGQDGALGMVLDEFGAFANSGWSGGNEECDYGDMFNPDGPPPADQPVFSSALFFYKADTEQRVILSAIPNLQNTYPVDSSAFAEIPEGGANLASDTSGDGVNDTLTSAFAVCGPNELDLHFEVVQSVEQVAPAGGGAVSVLTQVYTITNVSLTPIDFVLVRADDYDTYWVGDNADDSVGTMTNGHPHWDRHVYQLEDGLPETAITLSSPQGDIYLGAKDVGTDFQQWNEYGIPEAWANFIANVGYDTDGESGRGCGGDSCDANIALTIPVSLEPAETTCVCVVHTYGQRTPIMGTCPEGCSGGCGLCPTDVDDDGHTGPFDLAILLGSWGPVTQDSVCLDADQNLLIEAFDLAVLLANWGPCE